MNTNCNFVNKALSKGALLVGSRARAYYADVQHKLDKHTDWDLIVPPDQWFNMVPLFSGLEIKVNDYGGFRVMEGGNRVDIWMSTPEEFLKKALEDNYISPCVVDTTNRIIYTAIQR